TIFEYFGHEVHFWMFEIEFFRPSLRPRRRHSPPASPADDPSRIVRPSPSQRAVQGGCPIRRGYVCPNFEELNHVGRQS
ncbi:hypothetical protein QOU41_23600, partial [Pseudomonas aeruginosa]